MESAYNVLSSNAAIRLLASVLGVGVVDWASMTASLPDDAMYYPPQNKTLHDGTVSFRRDYIHWNAKMAHALLEIYKLVAVVMTREPRVTAAQQLAEWHALGVREASGG